MKYASAANRPRIIYRGETGWWCLNPVTKVSTIGAEWIKTMSPQPNTVRSR